ncbi:alanine racemase [Bogoriella caseilytica]|uniref:Alanine racemase n=1 Tax=Bogoriella caseilytica TaxID=56055 RepID=A0A3N2BE94_9MICO|nr:alanine racemase [Bogoriella caseilytica]ROR73583.1 alanine racemase [Bogoriella caseilytica]
MTSAPRGPVTEEAPDPGWAEPHPARALVDLQAIAENTRRLNEVTPAAEVMAVVKADAYGHGQLPVARTALQAGASWLGTAQLTEALALRAELAADGLHPPILAWLYSPSAALDDGLLADIDLSVSTPAGVQQVSAAAHRTGRTARIHLKVDTGMGRGGARAEDFGDLLHAAAQARAEGAVEITGIWSHLARSDEPEHSFTAEQIEVFTSALAQAGQAGIDPQVRHLANSAGALFHPGAHFDLVRPGIATYGLSPVAGQNPAEVGLRPAMHLQARVVLVKDVPPGTPVSYGGTAQTSTETRLAVVPLGYADGLPRVASDLGPVLIGGLRRQVTGRVCMDQLVVDLQGRDHSISEGTVVTLFGDGAQGHPTADDWARLSGTISYEMVSRIGTRVPRIYLPVRESAPAGSPVITQEATA